MKNNTKQILVRGIIAGILGATAPSMAADAAAIGKCLGANSCGKEGQNSCAGDGYTETTKADCMKTKKEWTKSTDDKKKAQAKKIKWEAMKS